MTRSLHCLIGGILTLLLVVLAPPGARTDGAPDSAGCVKQLEAISQAMTAFRERHGQLPDHLSLLVPEFLPSLQALHCPADHSPGSTGDDQGHEDPQAPISYSFEMRGIPSTGLAVRPGPLPPSDLPDNSWGTERHLMLWLRDYYGPRVPVVRCHHHGTVDAPRVWNLTLDGAVVSGGSEWRRDPGTIADAALRAETRFAAGPPGCERAGTLDWLSDYVGDWEAAAASPEASAAIRHLGAVLARRAPELRAPATALRIAARIALYLGNFPEAEERARLALSTPGQGENENGRQLLAEALAGAGRHADAAAVFRAMLAGNPHSRNIRLSLADQLAAAGNPAEAAELAASLDPGRRLIGGPAPAFRATFLDGSQADLGTCLGGHKALLLNFWFYRCGPCRQEFPQIQKFYEELKSRGLSVLAADNDDSCETIARYVQAKGWTFPVGLGHPFPDGSSMPAAYQVDLFPTTFVIDQHSNIVYRCVGWNEEGLRAALGRMGVK